MPFDWLVPAAREAGAPLPEPFASFYGPWDIPTVADRPYVYVNFVASRDGRISFNEPGSYSPAPIAMGVANDPWLMGLLRARADAVLIGDNTVRLNPDHVWRPEFAFPTCAAAFEALRQEEGLAEEIPLIVLSLDGDLPRGAAVFQRPGGLVVVATTAQGAHHARNLESTSRARVTVEVFGEHSVDVGALLDLLGTKYAVRRLLCEGGPRVYGGLLVAGVELDEFLTISPMVIGGREGDGDRPSLVEGVSFQPSCAPQSRILSLARVGDLLFLRSRYSSAPPVA